MKNRIIRILTIVIALNLFSIVVEPISLYAIEEDAIQDSDSLTQAFVKDLYQEILGRKADEKGLVYWNDRLVTKQNSAAEVVYAFFNSHEAINANWSDEEFIERCYKTILRREADPTGKAYWLNQLAKVMSRNAILKGFIDSNEFTQLCDTYGLERGTIQISASDYIQKDKIEAFVSSLYMNILGRIAEDDGLQYWLNQIMNAPSPKEAAIEAVTKGFLYSQEFLNRIKDEATFVDICYKTFLGRNGEERGKAYWLAQLKSGKSRAEVIRGFAQSNEFNAILESYGLMK
ncbi:MAG: DUF4214 domain-containing protein [Solobacterium sp.]|nr:DUF4214 domain-containing protein [Solobacterium sp.]